MSWRVVYSEPRAEFTARDALVAAQVPVVVPFETVTRWVKNRGRPGGKRRTADEPIWPRYVFCDPETAGADWADVEKLRGVSRFVRCAGQLRAVPDRWMAELLAGAAADGRVRTFDMSKPSFHYKGVVGDVVELGAEAGAFAGHEATVHDLGRLDEGQMLVELSIFGRAMTIVVPYRAAENIVRPAPRPVAGSQAQAGAPRSLLAA